MKKSMKAAVVSALVLLACGSIFAKGNKDKEEEKIDVEITETVEIPAEPIPDPDIGFAK